MRSRLRRPDIYRNAALAFLALTLALAGTARAAPYITSENILDETIRSEDIGPGAVGPDELASQAVTLDRLGDNSVTGTKVADGTVWGVDVHNGSLSGADVADGSLTGFDVANASLKAADLGLVTVTAQSSDDPETTKTATAYCPAGKKVLGGGGDILRTGPYSPAQLVSLGQSMPTDDGTGWTVRAEVIDHPGIPEFTLHYNDDGVVDGFASWIVEDDFSFRDDWAVKASAICV
jgi:hypothetical protein